jgi:FdhD protein
MATAKYQGLKYSKGSFRKVEDFLTVEEALRISINGQPFTVTMRTPGNDNELVRGLLFSEDIYKSDANKYSLKIIQKNNLQVPTSVDVKINPALLKKQFLNTRNLLSVSSCGICGKFELDDIRDSESKLTSSEMLDPALLNKMFVKMSAKQKTFKRSGGSHAAAAFSLKGNMLSIMEDIGRHNAVDKVIGSLVLKKKLKEARCLLISGRVSYEILSKTFLAQIPFLAAVSAPSTLAVDYAKELGITLMGFCRDGNVTVYSNASNVIRKEKKKV